MTDMVILHPSIRPSTHPSIQVLNNIEQHMIKTPAAARTWKSHGGTGYLPQDFPKNATIKITAYLTNKSVFLQGQELPPPATPTAPAIPAVRSPHLITFLRNSPSLGKSAMSC